MPKESRHRNKIELLQGTLDLLVLQTLLWGPQHGYGIKHSRCERLSEASARALNPQGEGGAA